ncbi:MAG: PQQ-binding-like beta-propeller repeat protein [Pseudomonadota bacterium]
MGGFLTGMRATSLLVAALTLAGCGLFDEDDRLEGERIKLREQDRESAARQTIRAPLSAPVALSEWTQTNGRAAHNSGNIAGPANPQIVWRVDAGTGNSDESWITSPPIVAGGAVLVLDAEARLSAFDAASGADRWRTDLSPEGEDGDEGFGGGLAAEGNAVFATTGFGEVLALNITDGEIIWRKRFNAPFRAPPSVANGVIVAVTRDNQSFALSASSGDVLWRHQGIASDAGLLGGASPAMAGGLVVLPYASGEMLGVDIGSGRPIWSAVLTGGRRGLARASITDLTGDPVIAGPFVLAANQSGRMVAIEGRSGNRVWTRVIGAIRPLWPVGDTLFLMSDLSELTRISLRDGSTLWRTPLPAFEDEEDQEDPITYSGPVVVSGKVLVTDSLGNLWSFDGVSGEGQVIADIPGGSHTGPVAAGNTIYVLGDDGDLVALR